MVRLLIIFIGRGERDEWQSFSGVFSLMLEVFHRSNDRYEQISDLTTSVQIENCFSERPKITVNCVLTM